MYYSLLFFSDISSYCLLWYICNMVSLSWIGGGGLGFGSGIYFGEFCGLFCVFLF